LRAGAGGASPLNDPHQPEAFIDRSGKTYESTGAGSLVVAHAFPVSSNQAFVHVEEIQ